MNQKYRPVSAKSLVGFVVGDVTYAVPIAAVREIVNPVPLTELPHAPKTVAGVADHRGEVVPIIDLRARFGMSANSNQEGRTKWILVDCEGRTVGLVVDQVTEVFGTGGEGLRPAPSLGSGDDVRGIVGVTTHDARLTFVLDVGRFEELTAPLAAAGLLDAKDSG